MSFLFMDIVSLIQAAFLGIVEGLTEFLPVSSTGHLILFIDMIGFQAPPGKIFEITIQLGAILAVCYHFRHKLFHTVRHYADDSEARHFMHLIAIAFLPSAILGASLHGIIKTVLFDVRVVATSLITGGIIILLVERYLPTPKYRHIESISLKRALSIGFFQTLAMIPGTSRSGATIMGALLLKLDRKTATQFSFFLAIPTMLGATVYDLYKNYDNLSSDGLLLILTGFITAFLAAFFVVKIAIAFISKHGFTPFAYYRILLGTIMWGVLAW